MNRAPAIIRGGLVAAALYSLSLVEAAAAFVCYSDDHYPSASFLGLNEQGYPRVLLLGKHRDTQTGRAPMLEQTPQAWVVSGERDCKSLRQCLHEEQQCEASIPKITLSMEELKQYRSFDYEPDTIEQKISACVQHGEVVYFGIGFYQGEGTVGLGGLGRYNTRSGDLQIRRLPALQETSVSHLVFDGKDLWISAASQYECIGRVPEVPLMRYNWEQERVYPDYYFPEFCGFNVYSMHFADDRLYIGSDMGFTVMRRETVDYGEGPEYEWKRSTHWVPEMSDTDRMQAMSCNALYDRMLSNPETRNSEQLVKTLLRFKQGYMVKKFMQMQREPDAMKKSPAN